MKIIAKAELVSHKLDAISNKNAVVMVEDVPDVDSITEPESSHSSKSVLDQFGILVMGHLYLDHSVFVHQHIIFNFSINDLDKVNADIVGSCAGVDIVSTNSVQGLPDIISILPGHLDTMNSFVIINSNVNTSSFITIVQEGSNGLTKKCWRQESQVSQMNKFNIKRMKIHIKFGSHY